MSAGALQPAYVLHRRRYRETSLIVDLLTHSGGRLSGMAKGALSGKRSKDQLLQPFVPLLVDWRGRGEMVTLTVIESASVLPRISGKRLYSGLYINELVLKLTAREDAQPEVFNAYAVCMQDIVEATDKDTLEGALRRFEVRFLNALGEGMSLTQDNQGAPLELHRHYHYEMTGAPTPCQQAGHGTSGKTLLALKNGHFSSRYELDEARRLMRRVIDHHLGGKPLKTRELFRGIPGRSQ